MKYLYIMIFLIGFLPITKGQQDLYNQLNLIGNQTFYKTIDRQVLIEIFKGRTQYWPSKQKILLVLPSTKSELAPIVAAAVFDGTAGEMQKYWLSLVFQGRGNPPVFLRTSEDIYRFIASNPGAIGFIKSDFKIEDKQLLIKINQ
jgi:ABC-type phosphate transport system substrate-binding protein